jgi:hypothetical protein
MRDYSALLEYCSTDRQIEVLESLSQTNNISKTARAISITRQSIQNVIKAVEKIARLRGYDPQRDLTRPGGEGLGLRRVSTNYADDGSINQQWVILEPEKEKQVEALRAYCDGLASVVKPVKPVKIPKNLSEHLASAVIFGDAHIGMLAHSIETMGEDYDLEKATADIRSAIDYCVECAPASEEGWFINVGDWTHTNDTKNATPEHGMLMDVGQRHTQTMKAAGLVIRYCIDRMLTKFGKVRVINARGNHDKDAAFALNMLIDAVYEKEPRVEVQANDSKFHFLEFGNCLIGVNHGDKINESRLAGVMTKLQGPAWGRTTFRRWWTGHIHHKTVKETDAGVTIESFHTLAPTDEWHASSGYGAERRVTLITLHKEFGEVNRMSPSIEMVRAYRG